MNEYLKTLELAKEYEPIQLLLNNMHRDAQIISEALLQAEEMLKEAEKICSELIRRKMTDKNFKPQVAEWSHEWLYRRKEMMGV